MDGHRTLGVGIGVFSAMYQAATGSPVTYNLVPAGTGWRTEPLNVLVMLVLATAIILPHE